MDRNYKMIAEYYSAKIKEFGIRPEGVDWNGIESQEVRFKQLSKVILENDASCSDIGCGYGAYLKYLEGSNLNKVDYVGYDISQDMIDAAKTLFPHQIDSFIKIDHLVEMKQADYGIASGIFNVRQKKSDADWKLFINETLDIIHEKTIKGFAFNMLTTYSDIDKKRDYLFYASPEDFFSHCKSRYSKNIALLHDYDLYEFTILVRK